MFYCSKCGRKLNENDVICPGCGNRLSRKNNAANSQKTGKSQNNPVNEGQQVPMPADPNSVQYVYVNKKTGRITNNPHVKTKSEGCVQYFGIVFAAIALVLGMVAGTVLLTNYFSGRSDIVDDDDTWSAWSQEEETSSEIYSEVSSESASSEIVSSEPASSEPSVPEEMTARYMNKKLKGKWTTDIPYKNMTLPGTFEFDGKGKVNCVIKAFLFKKKFDGTYQVKDGGKCTLTLEGLDEYLDNDTMAGNLKFVTDDKIEFTVDNTVWYLNRME